MTFKTFYNTNKSNLPKESDKTKALKKKVKNIGNMSGLNTADSKEMMNIIDCLKNDAATVHQTDMKGI